MIETDRPRLLSSRPMLAAVMPLPSEEVTPPVTKTYFAIARTLVSWLLRAYRKERANTDANATLGKRVYRKAGVPRHHYRRAAAARRPTAEIGSASEGQGGAQQHA